MLSKFVTFVLLAFIHIADVIDANEPCRTTDRWQGVIDCYDCEVNKCAKECITELPRKFVFRCITELPRNFAMCYNKTALFNLRELFHDCLANDVSKCQRLPDDTGLAFLLAHYDQAELDLNRRNECIFRCGHPRIMNCMNMCDPLDPRMDVQIDWLVKCYRDKEAKIHDMLVTFAPISILAVAGSDWQ